MDKVLLPLFKNKDGTSILEQPVVLVPYSRSHTAVHYLVPNPDQIVLAGWNQDLRGFTYYGRDNQHGPYWIINVDGRQTLIYRGFTHLWGIDTVTWMKGWDLGVADGLIHFEILLDGVAVDPEKYVWNSFRIPEDKKPKPKPKPHRKPDKPDSREKRDQHKHQD